MLKKTDQRKNTNVVVDPAAQLRLSIPFFVLLISTVVSVLLIYRQINFLVDSTITSVPTVDLNLVEQLQLFSTNILVISVGSLTTIGLLCFVLWIIFSHRIFGPAVALSKQIRELRDGNYDARVTLRKRDEFKQLAKDLNELAEVLKAKSGG